MLRRAPAPVAWASVEVRRTPRGEELRTCAARRVRGRLAPRRDGGAPRPHDSGDEYEDSDGLLLLLPPADYLHARPRSTTTSVSN